MTNNTYLSFFYQGKSFIKLNDVRISINFKKNIVKVYFVTPTFCFWKIAISNYELCFDAIQFMNQFFKLEKIDDNQYLYHKNREKQEKKIQL